MGPLAMSLRSTNRVEEEMNAQVIKPLTAAEIEAQIQTLFEAGALPAVQFDVGMTLPDSDQEVFGMQPIVLSSEHWAQLRNAVGLGVDEQPDDSVKRPQLRPTAAEIKMKLMRILSAMAAKMIVTSKVYQRLSLSKAPDAPVVRKAIDANLADLSTQLAESMLNHWVQTANLLETMPKQLSVNARIQFAMPRRYVVNGEETTEDDVVQMISSMQRAVGVLPDAEVLDVSEAIRQTAAQLSAMTRAVVQNSQFVATPPAPKSIKAPRS